MVARRGSTNAVCMSFSVGSDLELPIRSFGPKGDQIAFNGDSYTFECNNCTQKCNQVELFYLVTWYRNGLVQRQ